MSEREPSPARSDGGASAAAASAEGEPPAEGHSMGGSSGSRTDSTSGADDQNVRTLPAKSIASRIANMKKEREEMRKAKAALSKELRNAQKRTSRLKKRCRNLPDDDLLELLAMRRDFRARAEDTAAEEAHE